MSRGVESSVEEGVEKNNVDRYSCQEGVEEQIKDTRREARSIHQLLRSYRGSGNFLDQSTSCQRFVKIAIWKELNSSTDSQVSRRCRGGVKPALQNSFSRGEKHRYEYNQVCNSTNDPNNILSSQNHLSTTILSTMIPNTHTHAHTHTLNKSNQFYISKTS